MTETRTWLDADEQRLWRTWMQVNARLSLRLQRQLQAEADLSAPDFEVLVHLTDVPDGRLRVSDLADLMQWERSRLSHHLSRMERRGLVQRTACREDGRGALVVLTEVGRAAIEQAAPGHVATVRSAIFDVLSAPDQQRLAAILAKLARAAGCPEGR